VTEQQHGRDGATTRYEDLTWTGPVALARYARGPVPWRYYLTTKVRFSPPGTAPFTVVPIEPEDGGAPAAADLGGDDQVPPAGPLHVITAIQPGEEPSEAAAARRLAILEAELRAAGHAPFPATGSAFDGSHAEPGFAVAGWTDDDARRWGVRFGQVAVFGLRAGTWSLIACATDRRSDRPWRRVDR